MPDTAQVEVSHHGDIVLAKISGEVDIANAQSVGKTLDSVAGNTTRRQILDLSDTRHLDSVAIQLLFSLAERRRARRQELLIVVPKTSMIYRLLQLVDIEHVVRVFADRDSALAAAAAD